MLWRSQPPLSSAGAFICHAGEKSHEAHAEAKKLVEEISKWLPKVPQHPGLHCLLLARERWRTHMIAAAPSRCLHIFCLPLKPESQCVRSPQAVQADLCRCMQIAEPSFEDGSKSSRSFGGLRRIVFKYNARPLKTALLEAFKFLGSPHPKGIFSNRSFTLLVHIITCMPAYAF